MGAAEAIGFGGSVEYGVTAESAIEEVPDDNAGVGMVIGCVGSNQNINNNNENELTEKEPTRDRTPSAPRINVPTHTF